MDEHYSKAKSSFWSAWSDSDMRKWLESHNFKAEAKGKRDDVRNDLRS